MYTIHCTLIIIRPAVQEKSNQIGFIIYTLGINYISYYYIIIINLKKNNKL